MTPAQVTRMLERCLCEVPLDARDGQGAELVADLFRASAVRAAETAFTLIASAPLSDKEAERLFGDLGVMIVKAIRSSTEELGVGGAAWARSAEALTVRCYAQRLLELLTTSVAGGSA